MLMVLGKKQEKSTVVVLKVSEMVFIGIDHKGAH